MLLKGQLVQLLQYLYGYDNVNITDVQDAEEGDEIIVFGNELSVQHLAPMAPQILMKFLTGISQRWKRIYYEGE